ncbi:MAG: hypothetical protein ABIP42_00245 [Planctomycetota bacterium]
MLFANPAVAGYLNANFECAWESLRPVPQVHIDFGNGHTLERTLHGNIAFWFVTSKGEAFDLVPGALDARTFLARCIEASDLDSSLSMTIDPEMRRQLVAQVHRSRIPPPPIVAPGVVPDRGKVLVERGIKKALAGAPAAETEALSVLVAGSRVNLADLAKTAIELPLKTSLHGALTPPAPPDASALPLDTDFNRRVRFPQADRLLAECPLETPELLTNRVYLEILGVDLADPYLGLAPYLLGGEPGRH